MGEWAPLFETLLPIFSSILIVVGNLFVGKLLERKPTLAGKARPLILLGMPVILVSFLFLFLFPTHSAEGITEIDFGTSILVAVGYNLYYALAWPLYYTSHSALVNLSTRDGKSRGLLATCIMAAQLAAAGISGMFGGLLVDLIGLLPVYKYTAAGIAAKEAIGITIPESGKTNDFNDLKGLVEGVHFETEITRAEAHQKVCPYRYQS